MNNNNNAFDLHLYDKKTKEDVHAGINIIIFIIYSLWLNHNKNVN